MSHGAKRCAGRFRRRERAGRVHWRATPDCVGTFGFPQHLRCVAASQFPSVFHRTIGLSHRDLDAEHRSGLVGLPTDRFKNAARCSGRSGFNATNALLGSWRFRSRSIFETPDYCLHSDRDDALRIDFRDADLEWGNSDVADSTACRVRWIGNGVRHAGAPGIHDRNDQPPGLDECDLAELLDGQWSSGRRTIDRRPSDGTSGHCHVLLFERPQFPGSYRWSFSYAPAEIHTARTYWFGLAPRGRGFCLCLAQSADAHDPNSIRYCWHFRLVLFGADAGLCARCSKSWSGPLWNVAQREWTWSTDGSAYGCQRGKQDQSSCDGAGRSVDLRDDVAVARLERELLLRPRSLSARWLGFTFVFFDYKHPAPNCSFGQNAGQSDGYMDIGVWGNDTAWRLGGRDGLALSRRALDYVIGRRDMCNRRDGYMVHSQTKGTSRVVMQNRKPKTEGRKKTEIRNPKRKDPRLVPVLGIRVADLGFPSTFGFRPSDFL